LAFFFQAEDGIRDFHVTGVQTCALPIYKTFAKSMRNQTYNRCHLLSPVFPYSASFIYVLIGFFARCLRHLTDRLAIHYLKPTVPQRTSLVQVPIGIRALF